MRRRQHYVEMPDDGLVNFRGKLVTPERAQRAAQHFMEGFDNMPPAERYAWNYAAVSSTFNPSSSPLRYNKWAAKTIKAAGARALLDDLGL
jgi:hypothetical protein